MPPDAELFAFEADFVDTFRCIPMAVRFKLDRVGVKLTLRQWTRMNRVDREDLLLAPCEAASDVDAYRDRLCGLIRARASEEPRLLTEPPCGTWNAAVAPDAVRRQAGEAGVAPPRPEAWRSLPELRRFVLVKLARDNHDNINFVPAMREFGLA